MNELSINIGQIVVKPGTVLFNDFETVKGQALNLSEHISRVEVTEETVQLSKKMLAAVNNRIKEMEDRRISIKKEILEPYNTFEKQVKEIVNIVKEADGIVRNQVKSLEEKERDQKQEVIRGIFEKRMKQYDFSELFGFDSFISSKHLNKSTSINSVEMEMVQWLEKIETDLNVINSLPNAEKIMTEYLDTKDVGIAIRIVNEYEERMKKVVNQVKPPVKESKTTFTVTLFDEKDLLLVEMFMQQHNIKNKIDKVVK
jgi:DNA helicase HerA-like ATPase